MFSGPGLTVPVLLLTFGLTLWGGIVIGPRRIVPGLLILGPMFLPAYGSIDIPGLPQLDRVTAITMPACLLLLATPREYWQRVRWVLPDLLLAAFAVWAVICTVVNQGAYAGGAMGLKQVLNALVPYFAGRLYLQKKEDVVALARMLIPAVLVYVCLMAFEARMYPRFQEWIYGESVAGLGRWGLFRPIVFAQNTLELGHLMALLVIVMLAVYRCGGETRRSAGRLLPFAIAAGTAGVLLTLSRGPLVALLAAGLLPIVFRRTGWLAAAVAIAGPAFLLWMLSPAGTQTLQEMSQLEASSDTQQTLFYRFLQVEAFKPMVEASPVFGYGETWERVEMQIIDGQLLLAILGFGYPGAILLCLFWVSCAWELGQRTLPRNTLLCQLGVHVAPLVGWLAFSAWGDSFFRTPHYVLIGGMLGVLAASTSRATRSMAHRKQMWFGFG